MERQLLGLQKVVRIGSGSGERMANAQRDIKSHQLRNKTSSQHGGVRKVEKIIMMRIKFNLKQRIPLQSYPQQYHIFP